MTRLAHLSDLHLNGTEERRVRFALALEKAEALGAEHLILTGDLTADGTDKQFEEVAQALGRWRPGFVTLVGGNHDLAHKDWKAAILSTSLSRYYATSVPGGGHAALGDCEIYPVSTQYPRRALVFRALGQITDYDLAVLQVVSERERVRPIVVAMHHGPQWHPLQFFDGLTNRSEMISLLERAPNITILCGHDHRALDLHDGRIYTAASVADHDDPLRLYDVVRNKVVPVYRSADPGRYL